MTRNKPWGRGTGDGRREKKVWNCHPGEWEYTEDGKGCAYGDSPQHPSPHENGSVFEVRDPVSPSFAQLCPRGCGKDRKLDWPRYGCFPVKWQKERVWDEIVCRGLRGFWGNEGWETWLWRISDPGGAADRWSGRTCWGDRKRSSRDETPRTESMNLLLMIKSRVAVLIFFPLGNNLHS